MKKVLIVIDMQNDFVYDALGSEAAQAIVPNVKKKIDKYLANDDIVIFTRDTHRSNYMATQEGKHLPVPHCIYGTKGWCVIDELNNPECHHVNKDSFGYAMWEYDLPDSIESIELCGVCTDICVVSNALILKAQNPEVPMFVDASCCAGVTHESHQAALTTMKMCQINVIGE
jgi:nicotinamidase-related amidase